MFKFISSSNNNYPGLDRGFNQRFKLDADLSSENKEGIYLVTDSQDIIDALNTITNSLPKPGEIKVVAGGHCYENFVFQSATDTSTGIRSRFIIDVSNMRGISEENINGTNYITVEPGASNWLIQQTLHSLYGAALPGGSCYSVCAGGHIAGGGYGLLSRLHGLTVDYLAGVEMVIPDPENGGYKIRAFDPDSDSDELDWASRGGGAGHFGIVTKYYFEANRVPLAPERALFIALPVPWNQFVGADGTGADGFAEFLQAYYNACHELPEQAFTLGKFTCMQNESDIMNISIQVVYGDSTGHNGATQGGIDVEPLREQADALAVIQNFAAALDRWIAAPETSSYRHQPCYLNGRASPAAYVLDTIYDLPWIDMTQMLNGSGENQNGKYKSSLMIANFNNAEAGEIYAFLTDSQADNPAPDTADKSQTLIQIDSYGAQINMMDDGTKTAVAARSSQLKLQYQTYWKTYEGTTPEEAKQIEQDIVSWFNAGYNAIHWQATGNISRFPEWGNKYQGCYFNYPDRQLGVNEGYTPDPGDQYGDFLALYFGENVRDRLLTIKNRIDPENRFAHAQSVINATAAL